MNKKGFIQISFPWIFAIIIGIFVLFLAIYGVTKLIKNQQTIQDVKTSKELGILLNPLETGFEENKKTSLTFPVNTRIFLTCKLDENFGKQFIKISQESFNKWTDTNVDVGFSNKYIFANSTIQGKEFVVFSKAFNFPFKITDLNYIIPAEKTYCFINAPKEITEEIQLINFENILVEDCPENSIQVCFDSEDCNINVNTGLKRINKKDGRVYYEGNALMYAGIFSDKETYECQLKRLMKRLGMLCQIYKDKAFTLSKIGCNTNIDLDNLIYYADNFQSSANLNSLKSFSDEINSKNKQNSLCRLW